MIRKIILPLLALAGVLFAIYTVKTGTKKVVASNPAAEPSYAPFASYVAGSGIVEASTENIAIGTPVPGIVTEVLAKVDDRVKAGDELFKIDDRDLRAELAVRKAALATAEQRLAKLRGMPRAEEIPVAEAKVAAAEARLAQATLLLERWNRIEVKGAVSPEELIERRITKQVAEAELDQVKADLKLLKAGAWTPDIQIADAEVASAKAQVHVAQTDIDRLTVRAPVDATILQVKIRPGEFAPAGVLATPLVMLGRTDVLHVRVDVDENEALRVSPDARAVAFVRGNNQAKAELTFVRLEPYVVPKRSLTGESTERVDTRVLQVVYSFDPAKLKAYVGQQMDVYIEAPPGAGSTTSTAPTARESSDR